MLIMVGAIVSNYITIGELREQVVSTTVQHTSNAKSQYKHINECCHEEKEYVEEYCCRGDSCNGNMVEMILCIPFVALGLWAIYGIATIELHDFD